MKKTQFASGSFDGSYPRPVTANTLDELFDFVNNELESHNGKRGLCVNVWTSNSFLASFEGEREKCQWHPGHDAEYQRAEFTNLVVLNENEFSDTTGTMNESPIYLGGEWHTMQKFRYTATKRYLYDSVIKWECDTVEELVELFKKHGFKGTLNLDFKFYPMGPRCYAESIKHFAIVL